MGEIIACLNADKNDLAEGKQMMLERWGKIAGVWFSSYIIWTLKAPIQYN